MAHDTHRRTTLSGQKRSNDAPTAVGKPELGTRYAQSETRTLMKIFGYWVMPAVALTFVWGWVYYWVDPRLIYERGWAPFYLEWPFFVRAAGRPGGLIAYAGAYVLQFYQLRAVGSLITTALTALIVISCSKVFRPTSTAEKVLSLVPGFAALVLATRYSGRLIDAYAGFLLAIFLFMGWRKLKLAFPRWQTATTVVGSAVALWVGGILPALSFAIAAGIAAVTRKALAVAWPCWLPAVGVAGFWAVNWRHLTKDAFGLQSDAVTLATRIVLFASLVVLSSLWALRARVPATENMLPRENPITGSRAGVRSAGPRSSCSGKLVLAATIIVGSAALFLVTDRQARLLGLIELAALEQRWQEVLTAASKVKAGPTPVVRLAIARALFHTGKLHKELFSYPQRKGVEVLPWLKEGLEICDLLGDTMLELGQINLAEHFVHESLELKGERPRTLWQLARIYALKDEPKAAAVFLNRLARVPFHRARAEKRLEMLKSNPTLSAEPDISRIRPLRVTTDIAESGLPTEVILTQCLSSNKRNRMAFELLLAHYLLEGKLEQLVKNLDMLGEFGIWETPRHIEEAILLYNSISSTPAGLPAERRLSNASVQKFEQFRAIVAAKGGADVAKEELSSKFGDTYWFYYLFGQTYGNATVRR